MSKPPKGITIEEYKKIKVEYFKKYRAEFPDKAIEARRKWDSKNRTEYQRKYRLKQKTKLNKVNSKI